MVEGFGILGLQELNYNTSLPRKEGLGFQGVGVKGLELGFGCP